MVERQILMSVWKTKRQVVFDLPDGITERDMMQLQDMLKDGLAVLSGKKKSVYEPERFAMMQYYKLD